MTQKQKRFIAITGIIAVALALAPAASAMHVMEGMLPPVYCIAWGVLCVPFLITGFISMRKIVSNQRKAMLLLAMAGAFTFVLSSLKIPSIVSMSSSHPTGTGLGAVLFGPSVMSILGVIVLLFQSLLLAHGGLTTLGANTFSMAIAGPFLAFGVYKLSKKLKLNQYVSIFLAAAVADLFTYVVTAFQLGIAHPSEIGGAMSSFVKFMGIFAATQIPIAIIEGIITVLVIMALQTYAKPELKAIGFLKGGISNGR